jgi:hypothetical protein
MFINLIRGLIGGAVLTLALATLGVADAGNEQRAQVIGDMNVYLGVMSAEAIRAQPALRIEEEMHGPIPQGKNVYHILVTLFDRKSGERIDDATIWAQVRPLGLGGRMRPLEVMYSAGVPCYCQWFEMARGDTYRISVVIERQGNLVQRARFEYTP